MTVFFVGISTTTLTECSGRTFLHASVGKNIFISASLRGCKAPAQHVSLCWTQINLHVFCFFLLHFRPFKKKKIKIVMMLHIFFIPMLLPWVALLYLRPVFTFPSYQMIPVCGSICVKLKSFLSSHILPPFIFPLLSAWLSCLTVSAWMDSIFCSL